MEFECLHDCGEPWYITWGFALGLAAAGYFLIRARRVLFVLWLPVWALAFLYLNPGFHDSWASLPPLIALLGAVLGLVDRSRDPRRLKAPLGDAP